MHISWGMSDDVTSFSPLITHGQNPFPKSDTLFRWAMSPTPHLRVNLWAFLLLLGFLFLILWCVGQRSAVDAFMRKCVVTPTESITPAACLPSAWLLCHPVCPVPPVRADPAQAGAEQGWCVGWGVGCRSWRLWQDFSISEMSPGEVSFWMKSCPFGGCWTASLFSRKIFIEV